MGRIFVPFRVRIRSGDSEEEQGSPRCLFNITFDGLYSWIYYGKAGVCVGADSNMTMSS